MKRSESQNPWALVTPTLPHFSITFDKSLDFPVSWESHVAWDEWSQPWVFVLGLSRIASLRYLIPVSAFDLSWNHQYYQMYSRVKVSMKVTTHSVMTCVLFSLSIVHTLCGAENMYQAGAPQLAVAFNGVQTLCAVLTHSLVQFSVSGCNKRHHTELFS